MLFTGKHRIIDLVTLVALSVFFIAGVSSCEQTCYDGKQNQNEEEIDCGGDCVPCDTTGGTCYDGIQNQGETSIDCGGPCVECIPDTTVYDPDHLCNGNGGSSYFPLSENSYWIYELPSNQWFMYEITEVVTIGTDDYHHIVRTSSSGTAHFYLREDAGQTYRLFADASGVPIGAEEIYIPSSPVTGQQWSTATYDSIMIIDADTAYSSANGCTYNNSLGITYYSSGTGVTEFFTRGVGMIQQGPNAVLDSLVIF